MGIGEHTIKQYGGNMAKKILVSPAKARARAKAAEMDICWEQRAAQINKYQSRNPFSYHEWIQAFKSGWLKQHGLGYWSFPSPTTHFRQLWEKSEDLWFDSWRAEAKAKQRKFIRELRKKRRK